MFLDPCRPGGYAFALFGAAITFGKGFPSCSSRTGFAAKENGEIGVGAHDASSQ
jgi:hypothetical protein